MAEKNATLLAEKSSDNSVVRIRLVGHLDIMPESTIRTVGGGANDVRFL